MIRQNLLVLSLVLGCLTGCQLSSHCRPHSFRPAGMYGAGCGPCNSSCGDECQNRHHGKSRTAPLFPGDTYGQAGQCGCGGSTCGSHGSCDGGSLNFASDCGFQTGCGTNGDSGCSAPGGFAGAWTSNGCSQCGGAQFVDADWMSAPVPLPSGVSRNCGCGAQTTTQQYFPQPNPFQPVNPQTLVPSTPSESKAPSTSESTYDFNANGKSVEEGQVPVPPSDDPAPMPAEPQVFEPDPPLPRNVEPDADGVPTAATPVDPVSWKIPVR